MENYQGSLDNLGSICGTDKTKDYHDYLVFYEDELARFREGNFVMFEIGVYQGGSLKMWANWFDKATVVGIDIDPASAESYRAENSHIHIGDASKAETFNAVINSYGAPTIVLDDGSHQWDHQIFALCYLWPKILPGGVFIMEDLHTSFPAIEGDYRKGARRSAYDFLMELNRWVVGDRYIGVAAPVDPAIGALWPTVRSIHWYRGTCIIRKKD